MAPINQLNTGEQDYQENILSSWLATICLMAGMVVSLVGIKIWWFKHRLTFDQNGTQNGAAGGSQPMLRSATKDKRASQEVVDSVVAHGVFRKRGEDELEIFDRPKQLPPIRIPERSQSTSALAPPPRAKRGNITPEIAVVTRMQEPPPAPPQFHTPQTRTFEKIAAIREETDGNNTKIVTTTIATIEATTKTTTNDETPPSSPPRTAEPARLFQKVTLPKERKPLESRNVNSSERRDTGFMRPEDALQLDQWFTTGEPHIQRTERLQSTDIESPTIEWAPHAEETWESSQKNSPRLRELKFESAVLEQSPSSSASTLTTPQPAGKSLDSEQIWQTMGVAVDSGEPLTENIVAEFDKIRHSYQEHEGHFLELENGNEVAPPEMPTTAQRQNRAEFVPYSKLDLDESFNGLENYAEGRYSFDADQVPNTPLGYGHNIDEDWQNFGQLEAENNETDSVMKHFDNTVEYARVEKKVSTQKIVELSKSVAEYSDEAKNFENTSKIEELLSFEQHSNIGKHTQFEEQTNFEQSSKFEHDLASFEQFSTNIEQPSSFEQLFQFDQNLTGNFQQVSHIEQQASYEQHSSSNDQFMGQQQRQQQHLLSSATAYVQSIEELYDELSDNEKENPLEAAYTFEEVPLSTATPKTSILKEHLQSYENYGYQQQQQQQQPTASTRKLKSQQKVTFDVHTEEYYLPENESTTSEDEDEDEDEEAEELARKSMQQRQQQQQQQVKRQTAFHGQDFQFESEDDVDEEDDKDYERTMPKMPPPPLPRTAAPTPMQRTTKLMPMNHEHDEQAAEIQETTWTQTTIRTKSEIIENFENDFFRQQQQQQQIQQQQQQSAALLFSTQISLDEHHESSVGSGNAETDSWTAIRQRRYKQERQQQQEFVQQYESTEFNIKPQASPRLTKRHNVHRAPAPRGARKASYDDFEHGVTEV